MKTLLNAIAVLLVFVSCQVSQKDEKENFIYTVSGKINIEQLQFALTHEHIMSNFGAEPSYFASYDSVALFNQVVPYLKEVKSKGVQTIFDCTTVYFGRNVKILKELSDLTGIQLITNTGFYGGFNDFYVPESAETETEAEIANNWINEFKNGIDGTDIRPGFIKLGFDDGKPSDIDIKLFRAGILTHLKTGLSMAVHTGNNPDAAETQIKLLNEYKVDPGAWIWVHANKIEDKNILIDAAKKGAWISLDGVNESNVEEYVKSINLFREKNLLNRVLLSHDGNSFPRGGAIRPYDAIPNVLVPLLKQTGFNEDEINELMIKNPQEAFKIEVRKLM